MDYQKILNLLDNTSNQPSKCWTKDWVEINNESQGTYDAINDITFKTSIRRPSFCGYSDGYIHVKGTMTIPNTEIAATPNNGNKKVIFKNFAPFTNFKCKITNTQIDYANDIDQ